jgi:hypothetical protein
MAVIFLVIGMENRHLTSFVENGSKRFQTFWNNFGIFERRVVLGNERTIPNNFAQYFNHETDEISETHELPAEGHQV